MGRDVDGDSSIPLMDPFFPPMLQAMDGPLTGVDPKDNIILLTGSLLDKDKRLIGQAINALTNSQTTTDPNPKKCVLVDGPSFDATSNGSEGGLNETLQKIATFLVQLKTSGIPVKAILHLHDITVKKTSSLIQADLDMLQAISGEKFYPRIIFATAFWSEDTATGAIEEKREIELKGSLWKPFIDGGAQVLRIGSDHESILPNLIDVCDGEAKVLQLVNELVHLELPLRSTTAGVTLSTRLSPQYPIV